MQTSPDIHEVITALATARPQFPRIVRNKTVTVRPKQSDRQAYTFTYATLDAILDAVCPVLGAHGLVVVCGVAVEDDRVRVTTRLAHASGQWLETSLAVPRPATLQELGSCVTYLKRYSINGLLGIEGDTDDDANGADGHTIVTQTDRALPATATPAPVVTTTNGHDDHDDPPPTTIPTEAGLPCGGALIVDLQLAQLSMLVSKVETLATTKGGAWTALAVALQAERARRLARGRQRPVRTPGEEG